MTKKKKKNETIKPFSKRRWAEKKRIQNMEKIQDNKTIIRQSIHLILIAEKMHLM